MEFNKKGEQFAPFFILLAPPKGIIPQGLPRI